MKILVFGAEGIAGRAMMRQFKDAVGTTRRSVPDDERIMPGIDITRESDLRRAFACAPDVVINCAGVVKSECERYSRERVAAVNAEAPHVIATLAPEGCHVIHLSTDCVFDGSRGGRLESDPPDVIDLYGRTKAAGELTGLDGCVTLRTSFIGPDPLHRRGLLEWLFTQKDEAVGYTSAMWSGVSCLELARAVELTIERRLSGLYHVCGPVISKADLLKILIDAYRLDLRVREEGEPHIDRTMNGSKFERATGYAQRPWLEMAKELVEARS